MMLANEDPDKVARANQATSRAYRPALEKITGFDINWNIVPYPSPSWARLVFPDVPEDEAVRRLAAAVFAATRVYTADPIAAWKAHNAELKARWTWLNGLRFDALHYTGPGTDLTIGLADDHRWKGGASQAKNGITCNPNIPTEEVFTTPHRDRVEGHVRSTKPLSHQGTLIENIEVRFEAGGIVEAHATRGEAVLNRVLDTDEGARRLGEVALVPHSSPISATGILFYNTLFDENAACHIALGQCYADCFVGGTKMSPDEIAARGGNSSMVHVDWMIGSAEIDIDGIAANGDRVPVMRRGEWASPV
jgi:aminopeptidase